MFGGIAAEGVAAGLLVLAVVGAGEPVQAVLLQPGLAVRAGAAGIHHAADGGQIADLEFADFVAHRVTRPTISWPGTQGYIVPGHSLRAVWMSEWQTPQKEDFDGHIGRAGRAPGDGEGRQSGSRVLGRVSFDLCRVHGEQ